MFNRPLSFILSVFAPLLLSGCVLGMAFLADTAKARQTLEITYPQALDAVRESFREKKIDFRGAVIEKDIAEIKGRYLGEDTVSIFVHKLSETQCRIAVRVGSGATGKDDAQILLKAIAGHSVKNLR